MKIFRNKNRRISQSARLERQILLMLSLFSVAIGLWENFRQLWMGDNGFSVQEMSTLTSVATFISVAAIILVGQRLKMAQIKQFMSATLGARLVFFVLLALVDGINNKILLSGLITLDIISGYLVVAGIYPLITTVIKSNQMYSRRKLVEYLFRDVGVLVGGVLIGRQLMGAVLDYNSCLLVAAAFQLGSFMVMWRIKVRPIGKEPTKRGSIFRILKTSRLQRFYLSYSFLAATSFATALGLKMLILTNDFHFSDSAATNYLLLVGIISDIIGIYALKHFTPKNDYITMTIKFGIRLVAYVIAVIAEDPFVSLLAMTWSIMISTAYEDVSDGYYINTVDNRQQFQYSTLKQVVTCLGEATGLMLGGLMYGFGVSAILGLSAAIMVVQMGLAYYLIYLRKSRYRKRHSASRMRYNERLIDE